MRVRRSRGTSRGVEPGPSGQESTAPPASQEGEGSSGLPLVGFPGARVWVRAPPARRRRPPPGAAGSRRAGMPPLLAPLLCLALLPALGARGLRCSQPSETCLNGGKCEVFPNGTEACVCSGAFVGQRCQAHDPCLSTPCKNAGTCLVVDRGGVVDYTCSCRLGFSGPLCLTPQDNACLANPCRNGGTCDLLTLTEYKCRCPPGWSGKTCQQADPCASNPCANGGQCLPFEASYICGCPSGFHGPTCRQDVNECSQNTGPCHNGGTCLNEVGSFRCLCRATHTGPHCELPYVPCSPSPCQNGGTCRPTGDTTHECACLPGFTGQNCEENIDDCPGNRCQNGGTCVDGVNTYNCRCPPEWTGMYTGGRRGVVRGPEPEGWCHLGG